MKQAKSNVYKISRHGCRYWQIKYWFAADFETNLFSKLWIIYIRLANNILWYIILHHTKNDSCLYYNTYHQRCLSLLLMIWLKFIKCWIASVRSKLSSSCAVEVYEKECEGMDINVKRRCDRYTQKTHKI